MIKILYLLIFTIITNACLDTVPINWKNVNSRNDEYILISNGSNVSALFNKSIVTPFYYYNFNNRCKLLYVVNRDNIIEIISRNTTLTFSEDYLNLLIPNISSRHVGIYRTMNKLIKISMYTLPQCKKFIYENNDFIECTLTLYSSFPINSSFTWRIQSKVTKESTVMAYITYEKDIYSIRQYIVTIQRKHLEKVKFIPIFTYVNPKGKIVKKKVRYSIES